MKQLLRNLRYIFVFFMFVSLALIGGIIRNEHKSEKYLLAAEGENKAALKARYAAAGDILSKDGQRLAYSENNQRYYAENNELARAALHLVGDYTHNISNTIESNFQGYLFGGKRNLLYQLIFDISGKGRDGDDIVLTVDSRLMLKSYQQLQDKKGAIVVMNYKTGEILSMVSTPSTDPQNVIQFENIPDTALFNRALNGAYAPGSTFKIITAASYLAGQNVDLDSQIECQGTQPFLADNGVTCLRSHGPVNFYQAMASSCNHYFGQLAVTVGEEALEKTAGQFNFNRSLYVDRLSVREAKISLAKQDQIALSWAGIGQPSGESELTVSPVQLALIVSSIANQGKMPKPHIVEHMINPLGTSYEDMKIENLAEVISVATAERIEAAMLMVVEQGTGTAAQISGFQVAGKTGTVEVADQDNDNALFIGYLKNENHPYAIAVVIEDAGSGGQVAAGIASRVLSAAIDIS